MSLTPEDVAPLMRDTFTTEQAAWECLASAKVQERFQREARRCARKGQVPYGTSLGDLASKIMEMVAGKVLDQNPKGLDARSNPVGLFNQVVANCAIDVLRPEWRQAERYTPATALGSDADESSDATGQAVLEQAAEQANMNALRDTLQRVEASSDLQALAVALRAIPPHWALAWLICEAPTLMDFYGTGAERYLIHVTVEMLEEYPSLKRPAGEAHRMLAEWQARWAAEPTKQDATRHRAFILGSSLSVDAGSCPVEAAEQWYQADKAQNGATAGEHYNANDNLRQYKKRAKRALEPILQSLRTKGGQS